MLIYRILTLVLLVIIYLQQGMLDEALGYNEMMYHSFNMLLEACGD